MVHALSLASSPIVPHTCPHWICPTNLQPVLDPQLEHSQAWCLSHITRSLGKGASRQSQGSMTTHPCLGFLPTPKLCPVHPQLLEACPAVEAPACHTVWRSPFLTADSDQARQSPLHVHQCSREHKWGGGRKGGRRKERRKDRREGKLGGKEDENEEEGEREEM